MHIRTTIAILAIVFLCKKWGKMVCFVGYVSFCDKDNIHGL